jgi:pimeloyl-ACP methyl ester carboxylesterase
MTNGELRAPGLVDFRPVERRTDEASPGRPFMRPHRKENVMYRFVAAAAIVCAAATAFLPIQVCAQPAKPKQSATASAAVKSGRVAVNGVDYYYEIHGKGEPLLLLHGGLFNIELFGPVLPLLAKTHRVIAVDMLGHGHTALGNRKIDMQEMGDDMAGVLDKLGVVQADVVGYSMGGGVALRLAAQHPNKVRRLVMLSTGYAQDGFYPEMLPMQAQVGAGMAEAMKPTPMYQSYAKMAPRPEEFPKLLDQMGEWMRRPYDWTDDVKKLAMPVMLIYGDSDMFRPEHIVRFYQLLGGGLMDAGWQREHMSHNRLAILPDLTHYEIGSSPRFAATVLQFLDAPQPKR